MICMLFCICFIFSELHIYGLCIVSRVEENVNNMTFRICIACLSLRADFDAMPLPCFFVFNLFQVSLSGFLATES